jgi:aquaporin Z
MREHVWWKQLHWFEYGAELLGTAFLIFAGVSAVVFVFGTGSPLAQVLPDTSIRRLITGLLFAGCGALVAISSLGKLSGGHFNPAVSLAFWAHGEMHHFDLGGTFLANCLVRSWVRCWWHLSGEDVLPV